MENKSDAIEQFVSQLVAEKKFENLLPEVLSQIQEDLYLRVEDRINAVILNNLPEENADEFDALLDAGDPEAISTYCHEKIGNMDQLIAGELLAFRNTYLGTGE
ncbi:MAG: DUF5663 domain-containing protein [Candidatus Moraniibacteriota bacterium]